MAKKCNCNRPKKDNKSILREIEEAKNELQIAEKAFQWAKNEPEEIDAAIARLEAAMFRYNVLIKKAKEMGIKLDKVTMYSILLK
ncbi:Protein of unknown function [Caldanaerovirga acetigignens]|jgi:polyribonucleotide nucleotidyltransferase|uniref:DUF2508 domain-containing protein n=1 Tax=Caldanaerovirga acetigignens TaxID=447595 RepID=A0A1M7KE83_9FIRM|nr:DUF2508 family protein [Caldanaerovirga acetigignens]SHM63526.1 Protein of unknown function [Caldanaerovirga acetigignens]